MLLFLASSPWHPRSLAEQSASCTPVFDVMLPGSQHLPLACFSSSFKWKLLKKEIRAMQVLVPACQEMSFPVLTFD